MTELRCLALRAHRPFRLDPRTYLTGAACVAIALLIAPAGALAQRESGAQRRITQALEALDVSACNTGPEWAARGATVVVTVLADGRWTTSVSAVQPSLPRPTRAGLASCLDALLHPMLGDQVPSPPRTPRAVVHAIEFVGTPALADRLSAHASQGRAAIEACALRHASRALARIEIEARVEVRDGAVVSAEARTMHPAASAARCVVAGLSANALPDGAARVRVVVSRPPGTGLPRHDGRAGAVCRWGRAQQPGNHTLPTPRECRRGLTCCSSGGMAGSSSTCVRVGRRGCPRYP